MKKLDWLVAAALGVLAAVVFFASTASYAFPGESAHLQALWKGLDFATNPPYPLMAVFAKMFGGGNAIAPICGVLATVTLFHLVAFFIRGRMIGDAGIGASDVIGRIAGAVAAVVFMLTPGVRSAATHLEPRLFDALWAMLMAAAFIPYSRAEGRLGSLGFVALIAVMAALGFCDSALFLVMIPFALFAIVTLEVGAERKPYLPLFVFTAVFVIAFFVAKAAFGLDFTEFLKTVTKEFIGYFTVKGWLFTLVFATIPFFAAVFSCGRAYGELSGFVPWAFHAGLTLFSVLAVATPLSPSDQLAGAGVLPVATSALAAFSAGHLAAFWWFNRRRVVALAAGGLYAFVIVFALCWNFFAFDGNRGAFADETAGKILEDLGERTWFVSDGLLDDHLRLVAAKTGRELNLVSLARDLDKDYLKALGKVVREKGICGSKNDQLLLSLSLGVLPFVQDWFAADPAIGKQVAIYGAPDLWYGAGVTPVPEFLFFGADEKRVPDWSAWKRFNEILKAPKGWGSYRGNEKDDLDPVDRMRFAIRRHLGMVANNRGVLLQDRKADDEAFAMYELVLNEIDRDNVCALFNEVEMVSAKYPKALAKKHELDAQIKKIVDDKDRRYLILRLGYFYGYIRNPDMFVRLGFSWARSGRPGNALAQIRRAIDFVPKNRRSALLNMMAALYANDNEQQKSRRIYDAVLANNQKDHDALIGLMRLELLNGNQEKALEYLQRAAKLSPEGEKRARIEMAMVMMMKNDLSGAKDILGKLTDSNLKDMQVWSLLAAVTMQQYDAAKDKKTRDALLHEISDRILPTMEKQANNPYDYYVQTTKAFLLLRQGEDKRKDARDAFVAAVRARPDSTAAQDMMLGLDISLDDKGNAEQHAREVLRRNRNAPLANYVMGSLAIQRGEYAEAEAFLRKAAEAPQPNILALNDLAETLRRLKRFDDAEAYARKAIEKAPEFYIVWETLGVVLLDRNGDLAEAEKCIQKAIEISKEGNSRSEDVRIYSSLARVQIQKGDMKGAKMSIRKVENRLSELNEFEKKEFEEIKKSVR